MKGYLLDKSCSRKKKYDISEDVLICGVSNAGTISYLCIFIRTSNAKSPSLRTPRVPSHVSISGRSKGRDLRDRLLPASIVPGVSKYG